MKKLIKKMKVNIIKQMITKIKWKKKNKIKKIMKIKKNVEKFLFCYNFFNFFF